MISAYLNGNELSFAYDSANRLISAGQNSYTYNVEDVRVRNLCGESETTYAYNTNGRLSQLLVKTTDGVIMTIECRNNTSLRYFYAKLKIWHQIFFENLSIFIAMKLIQNRRAILYSRFYRLVENSKSFRHSIIIITKYVYGIGLIGEETNGSFKTYHFDYRGSTATITDINGNVTDTFEYDTYGNLISRTGTSVVIFLYNGRDGVVTDSNGLIYMRARYYSPELRRFINADIIAGEISNAVTLNRYAYANGNPVSNIDPFGLSAERGNTTINPAGNPVTSIPYDILQQILYVHNRKPTNFFYSDDYKNHVRVKVDQSGNITYSFTNYHDGLIADVQTTTNYYFVVQSAGVWKEQLDFKIETENLFNNEYVELINQITEFFTPPNGPLEKLEFYAGIFQVTTSVLAYLIGDSIVHNSETSAYLYDKVIYRDSSEKVPILKSVTTIEATKYFWQDSFTSETIAERVLF